jgi:hypothetical protein
MGVENDDTLIARACMYWANWIETGNLCLSSVDVLERATRSTDLMKEELKHIAGLDSDQRATIERLREIAMKHLEKS